jgi:hypothetical protein
MKVITGFIIGTVLVTALTLGGFAAYTAYTDDEPEVYGGCGVLYFEDGKQVGQGEVECDLTDPFPGATEAP